MPPSATFAAELLRIYHHGPGNDSCLRLPDAIQAEYVNDLGLGPIANSIYERSLATANPEIYSFLKGADLTIRAIYRQMTDATVELLAGLANAGIRPTLIKGISTADEYYAPSHLRVMGDVDLLVEDSESHASMEVLRGLGYTTSPEDVRKYERDGHHHLPIARHPDTRVCFEIHTRLFSPRLQVSREPLFQPDTFRLEKRDYVYRGHRVARFSPEFQLAFTVSKWAIDGNWAANLTSINDIIHILRKHTLKMNWRTLQIWMAATPSISTNMFGLVSYLDHSCVYSPEQDLRDTFVQSGPEIPPRVLEGLHRLLHYYPFNYSNKVHNGYARRRGHVIWTDLAAPGRKDRDIPLVLLRTLAKSLHHGKYNPLNWVLSILRGIFSRSPTE